RSSPRLDCARDAPASRGAGPAQLEREERMPDHTVGRLPWLFIASVVALASLAASAWAQAPLDGQSLVGEWSGSWRNKNLGQISGQYLLTIERVEARQVHGQVEITGPQSAQYKVLGTLDGNRLTFSGPN